MGSVTARFHRRDAVADLESAQHATKDRVSEVFRREAVMTEDEVRRLIGSYGFSVANLASRLVEEGKYFEYRMVIRSRARDKTQALAEHLLTLPEVIEFRISPTGD